MQRVVAMLLWSSFFLLLSPCLVKVLTFWHAKWFLSPFRLMCDDENDKWFRYGFLHIFCFMHEYQIRQPNTKWWNSLGYMKDDVKSSCRSYKWQNIKRYGHFSTVSKVIFFSLIVLHIPFWYILCFFSSHPFYFSLPFLCHILCAFIFVTTLTMFRFGRCSDRSFITCSHQKEEDEKKKERRKKTATSIFFHTYSTD